MNWLTVVLLSGLVCAAVDGLEFPPGFKFGAATAAYQVEGAWNASDKSPSIWDTFVRSRPELIHGQSTGDVACDSYTYWMRDVELASELGLHFYRMSVSWTRLLPTGFPDRTSEDGKAYYDNIINALLEKGIEPVVTLYHWDLPQSLQDLGGWANPHVADWFANYARVVFSLYGDRVKTWITLNEPIIFCEVPYNLGSHAPGIRSPGVGNYLCNKNALIAHAKAWRIYDKEFRDKQKGKVSYCNHLIWMEPESESDEEAVQIARQLVVGMYSHPVFSKKGGWPPAIEKIIAEKSIKEGFHHSRLPPFTEEEIDLVKGTYDYMGFNYYTSRTVRKAKEGEQIGEWPFFGSPDLGIHLHPRPEWKQAATWWFFVYPEGIRKQLAWMKKEYGDIEILITENGYASADGLEDYDRITYYKEHLEQILLAIKEDGVNVTGYTAWTLIDNFEWADGYSELVCAVVGGREFPPGFKFGAATAAYQVEGAWNASDKSPSIWDTFVRLRPEMIHDQATGDVACDSYTYWMKDVELASELGLHFYRMSVSWTRLLPTGFPDRISEDGKAYYNNIINALLEKGIEPLVTIYHWDLPQSLQDLGGWANPHVSDWFANYARVVFSLYGDRVKTWITLNEPIVFCDVAYNRGSYAPGVHSPGIGNYLCMKNALLAHAKAWRIYDKEFRNKQKGKVSYCNHLQWLEPVSESDEEAAETARQLVVGMYSHPVFSKKGGWPPVIENMIAEKSIKEGFHQSRLPPFTQEEIDLVKGTYDYMGFNYYTSRTVRKAKEGEKIVGSLFGSRDIHIHLQPRPEWKQAASSWFFVYPEGIRKQLAWMKKEYGDIEILITENGYASADGLEDYDRIKYFKDHLEQILLAIKEDGVNVTGYTAWTLIDNFEWTEGYRPKFGFAQVDFEHPERKRTLRASAHFYTDLIKNNALDVDNKFTDELYSLVLLKTSRPVPLGIIYFCDVPTISLGFLSSSTNRTASSFMIDVMYLLNYPAAQQQCAPAVVFSEFLENVVLSQFLENEIIR